MLKQDTILRSWRQQAAIPGWMADEPLTAAAEELSQLMRSPSARLPARRVSILQEHPRSDILLRQGGSTTTIAENASYLVDQAYLV
mmetsp:Transcript_26115/g.56632  ORF Transcript_26115/g.56632 Transcript_26115/m.56632 type:complete len:86 (-) Transcript_26115:230-487(-)